MISERAYGRVANILMLIGVASALMFDSGRFPRAAVGTVGIITGIAATVLYFWNQNHCDSTAKENLPTKRMKDEEIDTSDIPEVLDWTHAVVGKFYSSAKEPLKVELDADVAAWIVAEGSDYNARVNAVLRSSMARAKSEEFVVRLSDYSSYGEFAA